MAILKFTLFPESLSKLHDALVCLGKFSEAVCIEAVHDKLLLTALNSSKSAYASFTLVGNQFFTKYHFKGTSGNPRNDKFNCKIYNKALLSVFKGRVVDPRGERETAVERCDVAIEDGEGKTRSRFIVKIMCRHGVLKTYRLTFESVAPMHALFDQETANNSWSISSRTLREFVEHFGPGTEQLDIYSENGRVSLTSYTEKVMSGNEILKQPLHTTIAIDTLEFTTFSVKEKLHIVISVKDFKTIIAHAGTTNTIVRARYSYPSSPMQLAYNDEGLNSEFILMTIGEARGASSTPAPAIRAASNRPPDSTARSAGRDLGPSSRRAGEMPPPSLGATRKKVTRPSPPPPEPTQPESLFMPREEDDHQWDPENFDDDGDELLMWDQDHNTDSAGQSIGLQSTGSESQSVDAARSSKDAQLPPTQRVLPTQRLSDVRGMGLFDDD